MLCILYTSILYSYSYLSYIILLMQKIEAQGSESGRPAAVVRILRAGEMPV